MTAIIICSDFGAPQNKVCHCFHCFPIYLPWGDGTGCIIVVFWMLSFKPTFSLSSFTFIKRPFSSSSLSATRVVYTLAVKALAPFQSLPSRKFSAMDSLALHLFLLLFSHSCNPMACSMPGFPVLHLPELAH